MICSWEHEIQKIWICKTCGSVVQTPKGERPSRCQSTATVTNYEIKK